MMSAAQSATDAAKIYFDLFKDLFKDAIGKMVDDFSSSFKIDLSKVDETNPVQVCTTLKNLTVLLEGSMLIEVANIMEFQSGMQVIYGLKYIADGKAIEQYAHGLIDTVSISKDAAINVDVKQLTDY
jgi:hypothetical protein